MKNSLQIDQDISEVISQDLNFHKYNNKNILITGGSGLIGTYLVYFFVNLKKFMGINTNVYVSSRSNHIEKLTGLVDKKLIYLVQSDLIDLSNLPKNVDIIFHCASQASSILYKEDPIGTLMPNVIGTYGLLNHYKNIIEKFIFISSGEVFGNVENKKISEDTYGYLDCTKVRSCYGESKRMGENVCVSFSHQHKVKSMIIRPFHSYGPGVLKNDGRVFADFIHSAARNEALVIKSDGSAMRPFCYMSDLIAGIIHADLKGKEMIYNIGNPLQHVSIKELAVIISNIEGVTSNITYGTPPKNYLKSEINRQELDIQRIQKTGWKPRIDIKEGFGRSIKFVRSNFD
jgi:nucleoside-diphosphate-sugar epimerase